MLFNSKGKSVLGRLHLSQEAGPRFKALYAKGTHYVGILKWLFVDSVWRFKKQSFAILIGGFLGVTSQVGAIGQAIYYLRLLEKKETISAFGHTFEPRSSLVVFVLFVVAIFILLLVSSWLIYFSRKKLHNLRRRYEEFCSRRGLVLFGQNLGLSADGEGFLTDRLVLRSVRRDANFCGRTVQMLLEGIIPLVTLLTAVGILFYTNFWVTVLILGMVVVSMSLYYGVNKKGAKMSVLMEKTIGQASDEKREIISRFRGLSVMPSGRDEWVERHFRGGATKRNLDAAEGRRMATERSKLISHLLFAVVLCLILITLGVHTFIKHKNWASLVIYLLSLRFCFTNFRTVMSKITAINRFYPQFSRYFRFITRNLFIATAPEERGSALMLCRDSRAITGSVQTFDMNNGQCIGLVSPVELGRYTVAFLTECLMWASPEGRASALSTMGFVTSKYGCLPASIQDSLGLAEAYNWEDIKGALGDGALFARLKAQVPENLEEPCKPEVWQGIDSDLKFVLGLLAVSRVNQKWVMLEGEGLRSLPSESQSNLLGLLSDRIKVIVYHNDISQAGKYFHDVIAVAGLAERTIVGLGTQEWFLAHEEEIEREIKGKYSMAAKADVDDFELEYEEEDE